MAKRRGKTARRRAKPAPKGRKRPAAKKAAKKAPRKAVKKRAKRAAKKPRRPETLRTPPSSLDMNRTATAARSGRQAQAVNQLRRARFAAITGGDVDADMESAYFTGDETPAGNNPTPDQNDVDELGHSMGVEYQGNQELQGGAEVAQRDKHRWETE